MNKKILTIEANETKQFGRRELLKWVPPAVAIVTLPVHAQTTLCVNAQPVAEAVAPSKCSGPLGALVGVATLTIKSDGDELEINSISHDAGVGDAITLPNTPTTVTADRGIDISWTGPGSDAITCLPLNTINFTVEYTCGNSGSQSYTFNLTSILAAAVA